MHRLVARGLLGLSPEVAAALKAGRGVVALETTVITHGLPYPHNLRTAEKMESIVREEGAVPATIGILNGQVKIGLTPQELARFATAEHPQKVSVRDIASSLSKKRVGGTTVATTSVLAELAGIRVFATGGIGGVHRGAQQSWDVSADLETLGHTPIAVVCAGVKSILDVPLTLEYLETKGVPVVTYGPTAAFPGFFTPDSGHKAPDFTTDLSQIAAALRRGWELGLRQGTLVVCPIPPQHDALGKQVESVIQQALEEAQQQGVKGRDVTPFVLKRVNELTSGASMAANIALLENNARIAALLANHVAQSDAASISDTTRISSPKSKAISTDIPTPQVVVVGGSNLDVMLNVTDADFKTDGGSYAGVRSEGAGGVGRNLADALARLRTPVLLLSALGHDAAAHRLAQFCAHMDQRGMKRWKESPTPSYTAILRNGEVLFGVQTGMETVNHLAQLEEWTSVIADSEMLVLDGNISVQTMKAAVAIAGAHDVPVWFEPTDQAKVEKIFDADAWNSLAYASPNGNECIQIFQRLGIKYEPAWFTRPDDLAEWLETLSQDGHFAHLDAFFVTLGRRGVVALRQTGRGQSAEVIPPPRVERIQSVSGAGDCFNAGFISRWLEGGEWKECVGTAVAAAAESLQSTHPVPQTLSRLSRDRLP